MTKKLNVGILGIGEVGSSILTLASKIHNVLVRDINKDSIGNQKLDILHVCIPYVKDFEKIVSANIKRNNPDLTIIESTVPIKTTESIFKKTRKPIVHSPVRGFHESMIDDLRKFVKFVGPVKKEFAKKAKEYYATLGINIQELTSSRETELGKLLDTTYYALCIAWHQEMERFCKKYNLVFDEAVTLFNKTYNEGYLKTKPNVIRPVLTPGFIGGHCLMPNIALLKTFLQSPFLDIIEESNRKKLQEKQSYNERKT